MCVVFQCCLFRCWKGGSIEPHPTEKALIINYQLQVTIYGDPNRPVIEDTKVNNMHLTLFCHTFL